MSHDVAQCNGSHLILSPYSSKAHAQSLARGSMVPSFAIDCTSSWEKTRKMLLDNYNESPLAKYIVDDFTIGSRNDGHSFLSSEAILDLLPYAMRQLIPTSQRRAAGAVEGASSESFAVQSSSDRKQPIAYPSISSVTEHSSRSRNSCVPVDLPDPMWIGEISYWTVDDHSSEPLDLHDLFWQVGQTLVRLATSFVS